eukprot:Nk52_evm19s162 gene=Nk52_evmTU19s162
MRIRRGLPTYVYVIIAIVAILATGYFLAHFFIYRCGGDAFKVYDSALGACACRNFKGQGGQYNWGLLCDRPSFCKHRVNYKTGECTKDGCVEGYVYSNLISGGRCRRRLKGCEVKEYWSNFFVIGDSLSDPGNRLGAPYASRPLAYTRKSYKADVFADKELLNSVGGLTQGNFPSLLDPLIANFDTDRLKDFVSSNQYDDLFGTNSDTNSIVDECEMTFSYPSPVVSKHGHVSFDANKPMKISATSLDGSMSTAALSWYENRNKEYLSASYLYPDVVKPSVWAQYMQQFEVNSGILHGNRQSIGSGDKVLNRSQKKMIPHIAFSDDNVYKGLNGNPNCSSAIHGKKPYLSMNFAMGGASVLNTHCTDCQWGKLYPPSYCDVENIEKTMNLTNPRAFEFVPQSSEEKEPLNTQKCLLSKGKLPEKEFLNRMYETCLMLTEFKNINGQKRILPPSGAQIDLLFHYVKTKKLEFNDDSLVILMIGSNEYSTGIARLAGGQTLDYGTGFNQLMSRIHGYFILMFPKYNIVPYIYNNVKQLIYGEPSRSNPRMDRKGIPVVKRLITVGVPPLGELPAFLGIVAAIGQKFSWLVSPITSLLMSRTSIIDTGLSEYLQEAFLKDPAFDDVMWHHVEFEDLTKVFLDSSLGVDKKTGLNAFGFNPALEGIPCPEDPTKSNNCHGYWTGYDGVHPSPGAHAAMGLMLRLIAGCMGGCNPDIQCDDYKALLHNSEEYLLLKGTISPQ